ncbi:heme lyase CcmF/NrfE family subunit [Arcticibacter tournemirensis]|uniref:Cytochrome C biogenesis protein n=1 Tax=Arcticibacter tournemirensis TaxID=699437 RepID=A0A4Q0MAX3_9SPHI|nr:cytochrome c biogenesis protein CcsA [Arcticibacter tournemirensis]RXF70417.1 cytochrome C biogenesis protein [Arcticibacter tournemirensis]
MEIQFAGEHLLPGKLGQFFIILSFGTALLSAISYYFATIKDTQDDSWKRIGRISAWLNSLAVVGIGSCLFYIIYNHFFEYHYAWAHSSRSLPVYYIISSFWEGQEGSFWLWMFWQGVLANILIWKAKSWESSVMTTVMFSQVFLASMLLGVDILGTRIGSSPFILLRNAVEGPVFSRPDYLSLIQDGNGLNPLLQNYWMVIHPPTLFLGFASMIVPFAYAVAGLWEKRYKEWPTAALPWSLFAVMILGTGIIMGSFWAYEALNFGGFWAWDPVENASIIPWLTLIAGVHVVLAYKHSGHSYFTATFLVLISFVLVLYASFLTRSGVLGETSVHSFTDLGMFWHLVIYIIAFAVLAIGILIVRWKELPITQKDEETYSREFWLFIGALILTVSCIQVIATTSIPVFNAAFGTKVAPPLDAIQHYNKWQTPFAVFVALISGFTQFLKYRNTDSRKFYASIAAILVASVVITAAFVYITRVYTNFMFIALTFAAIFSILCNARILADAMKGKWKLAGSSVAHIGFALLLVGALVAAATNKVISVNSSGVIPVAGFEKADKPGDNLMLYQNQPARMDGFIITYLSDTTIGPNTFYKINYKLLDEASGKIKEEFNLYPNAQQNPKMGLVASPDTKHYLTYDIYTHINAAPQLEKLSEAEGHDHEGHSDDEHYEKPATHEVSPGDTVRIRNGYILVKGINRSATIAKIPLEKGDAAVALQLEAVVNGRTYPAEPLFLIKGGNKFDFAKSLEEAGLKLRFPNIYPEKQKFELMVYQKPEPPKKWVVMKAIKFPYINLFWGGTIIMVIGFLLSIFRRSKESKTV